MSSRRCCWNSCPISRSRIPERGTARDGTPAGRHADLQPHARARRGAAAALRLSLDRLSRRRARGGDHHAPRRRCRRGDGGAVAQGRAERSAPGRSPSRPASAEAVEWANAATILEKGGSPGRRRSAARIGVLIKDEEDLPYLAPELAAHPRRGAGMTLPPAAADLTGFARLVRLDGLCGGPGADRPRSSRRWGCSAHARSTTCGPPPSPRSRPGPTVTRSSRPCSAPGSGAMRR